MPRKRRAPKARRLEAPQPLSRSVMGVFLYGWGHPDRRAYGVDNALAPYLLSDAEIDELARVHRSVIQAEADRLGISEPWVFRRGDDAAYQERIARHAAVGTDADPRWLLLRGR